MFSIEIYKTWLNAAEYLLEIIKLIFNLGLSLISILTELLIEIFFYFHPNTFDFMDAV